MAHFATQPLFSRRPILTRLLAFVMSMIVAVAVLVLPQTAPRAEAADPTSSDGVGFGDCDFRKGKGEIEPWASQICWLDLSDMVSPVNVVNSNSTAAPVHKRKVVGDYTIEFDYEIVSKNSQTTFSALPNPSWNQSIFGKPGFFDKQEGNSTKDVLQMNGSGSPFVRLKMRNIVVKRTGVNAPLSNYRFAVADAESTGAGGIGEMISVDGGTVTPPTELRAGNEKKACEQQFGAGNEPKNSAWAPLSDGSKRGFVCHSTETDAHSSWVVGVDKPQNMEISMASLASGKQAIAIGVAMSRVNFGSADSMAKVESSFEKEATNQSRTASYTPFLRDGQATTDLPNPANGYTTVMRKLGTDGTAQDQLGFRSQTSPKEKAFDRYNPVWQCTLTPTSGSAENINIKEGSVPSGYELKKDTATGTSTLLLPSSERRQPKCSVTWEAKYKPASLTLRKDVKGSAANFSEIQLQKFTLHYKCTAPSSDFSAAYPDVKLEDDVRLERGTETTINTLPKGSTCTVTENFADGGKPGEGIDFKLDWNAGQATGDVNTPVTVKLDSTGSNTDGRATGSAAAQNNYDYKKATLKLSKRILGDPVKDGKIGGTYRFGIRCQGTNMGQREVTLDLTEAAPSNSVDIPDLPVGRDCTVTPLTDLSEQQRETMKFAGRIGSLDGQRIKPDESGDYHFTLPAKGATRELHFDTSYDYLTAPFVIRKEISGLAAGNEDVRALDYQVNYRCIADGKNISEGKVTLSHDGDEKSVGDVRVNADCMVWEDEPSDTATALFKGAKIRSSDGGDQSTELSNAEAKNKKVTTIHKVSGQDRNLVTVTNIFDPKLGTVSLNKVVESEVNGTIPDSYTFTYRCGTRNISGADGKARSVALTGKVVVPANGTAQLVSDDSADANLLNDQGGKLGVPYGNDCTFTEETPNVAGGMIFNTDADNVKTTVNAAENTATVTNRFTPAGKGLTVSLRATGQESLFPESLAYSLTCDNGFSTKFDLKPGDRLEIPAADVPEGTNCRLEETGDSDSRTSRGGEEYPIKSDAEYLYAADEDAGSNIGNGKEFTIGEQSTMDVHHDYGFVQANINDSKRVEFDDPNSLISEQRREIKSNRVFPVELVCTNPDGTAGVHVSTTVQQGKETAPISVNVGSKCEITEGETTTARGITLQKAISVNGSDVNDGVADFSVNSTDDVDIVLTNTYKRRTTDIELTKRAVLPSDSIRDQYKNAGKDLQDALYDHKFDLVCRDPETGDEAVLQQQSGAIKGEGKALFEGVPVGADCQITGDHFGSLNLKMNDGTDDLNAYLRPAYVDWVVDRAGGNAYPDQELKDDQTTSPSFFTVDEAGDNRVRLDNHYEYETSKVKISKDLVGREGNLKEVPDDYAFNFTMQCKAIGYQTNNIGEDSFIPEKLRPNSKYILPSALKKSEFKDSGSDGDDQVLSFASDEAVVPAGSFCRFVEQDSTNTPSALRIAPDERAVSGYSPEPNAEGAKDLHFVNRVERRTAPVRLVVNNFGYLAGTNPQGYTADVVCKDPANSIVNRSFPLSAVGSEEIAKTDLAPRGGQTVALPVGSECELKLGGPALKPRGQLEVTAGARTPLTQYATWLNNSRQGGSGSLADISRNEVTKDNKKDSYTFTTPADLPSTEEDLVIGTDIYHPRAHYDATFTKEAVGQVGKDATFHFRQVCSDPTDAASPQNNEFSLRSGQSHTISNIPVDGNCTVFETDDGVENSDSIFQISNSGDLIEPDAPQSSGSATNGGASASDAKAEPTRPISFTVRPVDNGTDTSRSGDRWTLTAENKFAAFSVKKSIEGTPLGKLTGDLFDTTLLPSKAQNMKMSYEVTNDGAYDLRDFRVTDASLAGLTVSKDGKSAKVGANGVIPTEVCAPPKSLKEGSTFSCSFEVAIPVGENETYHYPEDGEPKVEVTATANDNGYQLKASASDSQGALRPSGLIGGLLPETGMQTLIWVLVLGLLLLGFGLWRYLRCSDEEES